ncbi:hypothetical protein N871_07575 [Helicobacter pylori X47-2AL]|uniref:Uncharacterized protein n=1 Tax=Helicobacter pylori X47-2AL TaxID=1386083 RepID=V6L8A9_HELPX|nr:hypothetical protein N871_07575 [Helicobacter pylori X47-2AL]
MGLGGKGVVGELFQNASYLFMSFKTPFFKKIKNN